MIRHIGKYRGKTIVFHPREAVMAHVDSQEIKQVVLNLIVNALESMDHQGTLRIDLRYAQGMAEMVFADDGCGMEPDVLENIFEPFFTRRRVGKGTGLGLSITHRIISQHHGEITAVSPGAGKGSTFTVRLPIHPTEIDGDGRPARPRGVDRRRHRAGRAAYLIHEGSRSAARLPSGPARAREDDTEESSHGKDPSGRPADPVRGRRGPSPRPDADGAAPAGARGHRLPRRRRRAAGAGAGLYDAALLDIRMPGLTGIEVLGQIRQISPETQVIILTGHATVDTAVQALRLGAFDYLTKPCKWAELEMILAPGRRAPRPGQQDHRRSRPGSRPPRARRS